MRPDVVPLGKALYTTFLTPPSTITPPAALSSAPSTLVVMPQDEASRSTRQSTSDNLIIPRPQLEVYRRSLRVDIRDIGNQYQWGGRAACIISEFDRNRTDCGSSKSAGMGYECQGCGLRTC
ncbi:hypothetical protein Bbelb_143670 [Branchiostoma belcheri]|nr:hypothetical protein Bbelb_143670 [Branchiostoma belcheri]